MPPLQKHFVAFGACLPALRGEILFVLKYHLYRTPRFFKKNVILLILNGYPKNIANAPMRRHL